MSDSLNRDRFPALTALVEKWAELTRTVTVLHPDAPASLEAEVWAFKDRAEDLLGYEPLVALYPLEDRWVIDVARRGTATTIRDLRTVAEVSDWELAVKAREVAIEFRIEGQRFPEFYQDKPFSRTRFAYESPDSYLREIVAGIENSIRARFDTEPFITVYARPAERFDAHVSLDSPAENHELALLLETERLELRKRDRLLDLRLFVDGEPLEVRVERARSHEPDLSLVSFDPLLRRI